MKHGDQIKIRKYTNIGKTPVSFYFTGKGYVSKEKRLRITKAIKALGIDYKQTVKLDVCKETYLPDRWDIYNNLLHGDLSKIAKKVGCSVPHIKGVLEGKRADYKGIIREGELMAAINLWKTRFCKYRSRL